MMIVLIPISNSKSPEKYLKLSKNFKSKDTSGFFYIFTKEIFSMDFVYVYIQSTQLSKDSASKDGNLSDQFNYS